MSKTSTMTCPACMGRASIECGMCKGHRTVEIVERGTPDWHGYWDTERAEGVADPRAETER
jgi:hypothetical protein